MDAFTTSQQADAPPPAVEPEPACSGSETEPAQNRPVTELSSSPEPPGPRLKRYYNVMMSMSLAIIWTMSRSSSRKSIAALRNFVMPAIGIAISGCAMAYRVLAKPNRSDTTHTNASRPQPSVPRVRMAGPFSTRRQSPIVPGRFCTMSRACAIG